MYKDIHAYPAYVVHYRTSGTPTNPYADAQLFQSLKRIDIDDTEDCTVRFLAF